MRRTEIKICRNCKRAYIWTSGGFVASPKDIADRGLCAMCRARIKL